MKLRHKIAGTLALPLALAIASTANAATVVDTDAHTLKIGGFVGATAGWTIFDDAGPAQDSDVDFGMGLGVSRLNIAYTQKTAAGNITYLYENDWAGKPVANGGNYRLRHAVIKYDGWSAGYTWSAFANLTGLAETIDAAGTSGISATAPRTASLGKDIKIADGMSVGLFVEDNSHPFNTSTSDRAASGAKLEADGTIVNAESRTNTAVPDVVANFKGDFGVAQAFAAVRMIQVEKNGGGSEGTEGEVDFTVGVNSQIDALNLKAAVTSFDSGDLGASVAAQYKFTDQIRANLVVEQFVGDTNNTDRTGVWVNGFYKMDAGWEWGAELRSVSADAGKVNGLGDKDMSFTLQAKYAF